MVDEAEQGRSTVRWRAARGVNSTVSLGDVLGKLMKSQVAPRQNRFGLITEAWGQMLPAELFQHCRIVDVSGGRMRVLVDSPSYMYELKLLSHELLKELEQQCPRARIKEIKFSVG